MSAPLYKRFNLAEVPPLNEHNRELDMALFSVDTIIRQQNMDVIYKEANKDEIYQANHDDILAKDMTDIKTKPYITQGKIFDSVNPNSSKNNENIRQPAAASVSQNKPQLSFSSRLKEARDRYNQPSSTISIPYSSSPKIR